MNFTSPIVENALKTGARGSTKTVTNYGVVGDAMFKKAQLDLGIAELKGGMAMQATQLMSGLEMDKAKLAQGGIAMRMDHDLKLRDMKMELEANEVGFFEGLMGTIGGAASGAMTGFMVGGPVGAVVGGVAGGAATATGYATEGRKGGQAAQNMLGTVANAAGVIKGGIQAKKGEDAWKSYLKTGQDLVGMANNMSLPQQQRAEAQGKVDQHLASGFGVLTNDLKMNPEQATSTLKGYGDVLRGASGGGAVTSDNWQVANMRRAVEATADPRFDDPGQSREALTDFISDTTTNYASAFGGKDMPPDLLDNVLKQSGIQSRRGVMDMAGIAAPTATPSEGGGATTAMPKSSVPSIPRTQQQQNLGPRDLAEHRIQKPQVGSSVRQAPPSFTAPVQTRSGTPWHAPMALGSGVQMDDGQPPAAAEQKLAAQGADTVKALGLNIQMQDDKTQRNGRGVKDISIDDDGIIQGAIDKVKQLDQAVTPENIGKQLGKGASWVKDKIKQLDQAVTPRSINQGIQNAVKQADPNVVPAAASAAEPERGPQKPPRDWDAEIASKEPESIPFFKEKDSRAIQKAYGAEGKHLEKEDRERVAGSTAAAAQINKLRDELTGLRDVKGLDRQVLADYQTYKLGTIGEDGITGGGAGAQAGGFGGSFSKFEKSVRQGLEGRGIKGAAADDVIQKLKTIDSKVDPLAQSLAVAKQGSRPSDTDVAAYKSNLVNLMDPNPDNSIAGLISLQDLIYEDFRSFMNLVPSKGKYLSEKADAGRAGRMTSAEAASRRAPPKAPAGQQKSYFEKLRDGDR